MKRTFILVALATALLGCGGSSNARHGAFDFRPVQLYEGFTLGQLLAEPIATPGVTGLNELLEKRWYAPFTFVEADAPHRERVVASCADFQRFPPKGIELAEPSHRNALMELAVMCHAAMQLSKAMPAKQTFLRDLRLDESLPLQLPAEFALITSAKERERVADNPADLACADVANKLEAEQIGRTSSTYRNGSHRHEIQLIGRGDINHDGTEDVILSSRDTIEGASWFGLRLFVITRLSASDDIVVLEQYSLD